MFDQTRARSCAFKKECLDDERQRRDRASEASHRVASRRVVDFERAFRGVESVTSHRARARRARRRRDARERVREARALKARPLARARAMATLRSWRAFARATSSATSSSASTSSSVTSTSNANASYKFASAISRKPSMEEACAEACAKAKAGARARGRPTWVSVYVTSSYGERSARAGALVRKLFEGEPKVIGAVVRACVGGDGQSADGVSVTCAYMPGTEATTFAANDSSLPQLDRGEWRKLVTSSKEGTSVGAIVLAGAEFVDVDEMLERLHGALPNSVAIGGIVDHGRAMFVDDDVFTHGAVGMLLRGDFELSTHIAHGARPVGPVMSLTHAQGNAVLELDDSPAHPALLETLEALPEHSKSLPVMLGIGANGARGSFVCRDILSVSESGAVEVAAVDLQEGVPVQLHVRDAQWATEQAKKVISRCVTSAKMEDLDVSEGNTVGALIFACANANRMHASTFREQLPKVPLGGAYVRSEFGPLVSGVASSVLSHTSTIGIFRKK